jgi:antitoxin YobK
MSVADVDNAINLTRQNPRASFLSPRSEALILSAEAALGLPFPPSYRRFVSELGYAAIGGQVIYGVASDNFIDSTVPNGVWVTLNERQFPNTPHEMIVVGSTGYCSFYVLDTARRTPDGECPVIEWWPGSGDDPADCKVVAEDFGAFFLMLVQEALQPDDQSRAE